MVDRAPGAGPVRLPLTRFHLLGSRHQVLGDTSDELYETVLVHRPGDRQVLLEREAGLSAPYFPLRYPARISTPLLWMGPAISTSRSMLITPSLPT